MVDVEAGKIVEPDEGGIVELEIVVNFVVEARFGFAVDGGDDGHIAGAEIDGPAEADVGLEDGGIGGADFAEAGVAGEDDALVARERREPDVAPGDVADAVGELLF